MTCIVVCDHNYRNMRGGSGAPSDEMAEEPNFAPEGLKAMQAGDSADGRLILSSLAR